jgi:hypothetical protein
LKIRYPSIFKNFDKCLLCNREQESNEHFWRCPHILDNLKPIFIKHEKLLEKLLLTHADNFDSQIISTLRMTHTFPWTRIPNFSLTSSHPLYLLLHGFIPNDLSHAFTFHIKKYKTIKNLFLSFLTNLTNDIRLATWKKRNTLFKEWKHTNNITKSTFKNYRNSNSTTSLNTPSVQPRRSRQPEPFYTVSDSVRQRSARVAFVYATSSNFLHNGPWYNHLCDSDLSLTFEQLRLSSSIFYL